MSVLVLCSVPSGNNRRSSRREDGYAEVMTDKELKVLLLHMGHHSKVHFPHYEASKSFLATEHSIIFTRATKETMKTSMTLDTLESGQTCELLGLAIMAKVTRTSHDGSFR
mmetsp:Transcript_8767/g.11639  ORF Transcript_8767/g.11639 Transcript_8767/m.11639 type:complete len:111 (+) Transcript_8767:344-676(+)|eukprot:CAMPEP_0198151750 /NCGR_PEP_ID=MMETSP1443-20131203/56966_1 /TAXON_ID=186043 /ORGANISM="Entomoneis sp., Strain CCMP2396" /LENGTH=110 /DNA_ID=CAMNT_0043817533 /DNA_START=312 /DNA_END=641 /DNA_ORIENTATION=-